MTRSWWRAFRRSEFAGHLRDSAAAARATVLVLGGVALFLIGFRVAVALTG